MSTPFKDIFGLIREIYGHEGIIPLHEPRFGQKEKDYVLDCIETTYVSSVGEYVSRFEEAICAYTGAAHAIATVNGTSALHLALMAAGVKPGDEVLTQALSFIATANAIHYTGAALRFIDIEEQTLGISPIRLKEWLDQSTYQDEAGVCRNVRNGKRISACVPMHTFGHPSDMEALCKICDARGIVVIEDAAESLGSFRNGKHTGTFGKMGTLSFNGNKVLTTGGGGMVLSDDPMMAQRVRHLSTQSKVPHAWEYIHDDIGYNYRMPNLNAALGLAQMEYLEVTIEGKRVVSARYRDFFETREEVFIPEPDHCRSNYWLNAILFSDLETRDHFLKESARQGIATRPAWKPINELGIFPIDDKTEIPVTLSIYKRLVNLPSSSLHGSV